MRSGTSFPKISTLCSHSATTSPSTPPSSRSFPRKTLLPLANFLHRSSASLSWSNAPAEERGGRNGCALFQEEKRAAKQPPSSASQEFQCVKDSSVTEIEGVMNETNAKPNDHVADDLKRTFPGLDMNLDLTRDPPLHLVSMPNGQEGKNETEEDSSRGDTAAVMRAKKNLSVEQPHLSPKGLGKKSSSSGEKGMSHSSLVGQSSAGGRRSSLKSSAVKLMMMQTNSIHLSDDAILIDAEGKGKPTETLSAIPHFSHPLSMIYHKFLNGFNGRLYPYSAFFLLVLYIGFAREWVFAFGRDVLTLECSVYILWRLVVEESCFGRREDQSGASRNHESNSCYIEDGEKLDWNAEWGTQKTWFGPYICSVDHIIASLALYMVYSTPFLRVLSILSFTIPMTRLGGGVSFCEWCMLAVFIGSLILMPATSIPVYWAPLFETEEPVMSRGFVSFAVGHGLTAAFYHFWKLSQVIASTGDASVLLLRGAVLEEWLSEVEKAGELKPASMAGGSGGGGKSQGKKSKRRSQGAPMEGEGRISEKNVYPPHFWMEEEILGEDKKRKKGGRRVVPTPSLEVAPSQSRFFSAFEESVCQPVVRGADWVMEKMFPLTDRSTLVYVAWCFTFCIWQWLMGVRLVSVAMSTIALVCWIQSEQSQINFLWKTLQKPAILNEVITGEASASLYRLRMRWRWATIVRIAVSIALGCLSWKTDPIEYYASFPIAWRIAFSYYLMRDPLRKSVLPHKLAEVRSDGSRGASVFVETTAKAQRKNVGGSKWVPRLSCDELTESPSMDSRRNSQQDDWVREGLSFMKWCLCFVLKCTFLFFIWEYVQTNATFSILSSLESSVLSGYFRFLDRHPHRNPLLFPFFSIQYPLDSPFIKKGLQFYVPRLTTMWWDASGAPRQQRGGNPVSQLQLLPSVPYNMSSRELQFFDCLPVTFDSGDSWRLFPFPFSFLTQYFLPRPETLLAIELFVTKCFICSYFLRGPFTLLVFSIQERAVVQAKREKAALKAAIPEEDLHSLDDDRSRAEAQQKRSKKEVKKKKRRAENGGISPVVSPSRQAPVPDGFQPASRSESALSQNIRVLSSRGSSSRLDLTQPLESVGEEKEEASLNEEEQEKKEEVAISEEEISTSTPPGASTGPKAAPETSEAPQLPMEIPTPTDESVKPRIEEANDTTTATSATTVDSIINHSDPHPEEANRVSKSTPPPQVQESECLRKTPPVNVSTPPTSNPPPTKVKKRMPEVVSMAKESATALRAKPKEPSKKANEDVPTILSPSSVQKNQAIMEELMNKDKLSRREKKKLRVLLRGDPLPGGESSGNDLVRKLRAQGLPVVRETEKAPPTAKRETGTQRAKEEKKKLLDQLVTQEPLPADEGRRLTKDLILADAAVEDKTSRRSEASSSQAGWTAYLNDMFSTSMPSACREAYEEQLQFRVSPRPDDLSRGHFQEDDKLNAASFFEEKAETCGWTVETVDEERNRREGMDHTVSPLPPTSYVPGLLPSVYGFSSNPEAGVFQWNPSMKQEETGSRSGYASLHHITVPSTEGSTNREPRPRFGSAASPMVDSSFSTAAVLPLAHPALYSSSSGLENSSGLFGRTDALLSMVNPSAEQMQPFLPKSAVDAWSFPNTESEWSVSAVPEGSSRGRTFFNQAPTGVNSESSRSMDILRTSSSPADGRDQSNLSTPPPSVHHAPPSSVRRSPGSVVNMQTPPMQAIPFNAAYPSGVVPNGGPGGNMQAVQVPAGPFHPSQFVPQPMPMPVSEAGGALPYHPGYPSEMQGGFFLPPGAHPVMLLGTVNGMLPAGGFSLPAGAAGVPNAMPAGSYPADARVMPPNGMRQPSSQEMWPSYLMQQGPHMVFPAGTALEGQTGGSMMYSSPIVLPQGTPADMHPQSLPNIWSSLPNTSGDWKDSPQGGYSSGLQGPIAGEGSFN